MLFRLVRPVKRKGSSNFQFTQRIPADLKARMVGMKLAIPVGDEVLQIKVSGQAQTVRFSLRTSDPSEVKDRQAAAASYLEQVFGAIRTDGPISLSHRNAVALSGDIYRSWSSDFDNERSIGFEHTDQGWVKVENSNMAEVEAEYSAAIVNLDRLKAQDNEDALDQSFGPLVDRLLLNRGVSRIDAPSRSLVLHEFIKALRDGFEVRKRKAQGDYAVDPKINRFPQWEDEPSNGIVSAVSLTGLVEGWWKEATARNLSPSTFESYRKAIHTFADFLGHDDALRVSKADVLRFKDHLLASTSEKSHKPLSAKTVKDSYLSGLKSVFGWAVDNLKLAENPAKGITIKVGRRYRPRDTWFDKPEIEAILAGASNVPQRNSEPVQRYGLKRWVPWLCAYSGARVGEMVQLRKQDIWHDGERWIITITPEAVTVKNKERRDIPVHKHLVESGFIDFVKSAEEGPLFMWSGTERAAWRTAKNRLTEFIRTIVDDPNLAPNHAWRHTFKTIGSEAGIQDKVLDALCGHRPRTEGESYGGVTMATKNAAIELFPRFAVETQAPN